MTDLLFLAQRLPYPPTKGEKIRSMRLLDHLRQSHDVHLGCLLDDPFDEQYVPLVREMCASTYVARLHRGRARIGCLGGLLSGEALSVTFYRDRGLTAWVERVLHEVRPPVIVVSSSNMAPYILGRIKQPSVKIVDLVDVDSEKWSAYARSGTGPMRHVHAREARMVAGLEARIVAECDWSVLVSPAEAALLASRNPGGAARIRSVSNGVDHAFFDPERRYDPPYPLDRPNFIFTGTMDYRPNIEAVDWFARAVLPSIRVRLPDAAFHIVGANPAPAVEALGKMPGVAVTGRVPDVRPYLAFATAAVAPMRIGRGVQNKVLEGMAMARPVVVTREALEGIAAAAGREVLVGATSEAFAQACVMAHADGAGLGAAARARVMSDYVWAEAMRGFDAMLGPPSWKSNVSASSSSERSLAARFG